MNSAQTEAGAHAVRRSIQRSPFGDERWTGRAVWELPQQGAVNSWGGVLSTAGGVVIFGEDSGALMAADASTGKPLWSFQTNALWKASPMTYMFDNKQYVAVAAGQNIIAFGLP